MIFPRQKKVQLNAPLTLENAVIEQVKNFKLLLDRFSFFAKLGKLVEKMTYQKKNRGH